MSLKKIFKENNWFPVIGEIDEDLVEDFREYANSTEEMKIFFNTGGGRVTSALKIVDYIILWKELLKKPVRSFCIDECCSAGLTILSACDFSLRECTINTSFLFHSTTYSPQLKHDGGLTKAIERVKKNWKLWEKSIEQESIGFCIPKKKILSFRKDGDEHGYSLTAEEMVKLKMISKIRMTPSVL
jgi:ATP-dependent protease ClpP protease subunit